MGKGKTFSLSFFCFDKENEGKLALCIYEDCQGMQLEVAFPQVTQALKDGRRSHKAESTEHLGYKDFTKLSKGWT